MLSFYVPGSNRRPGPVDVGPIGFNRVLINSSVDHAQIVEDFGGLRTFARARNPGTAIAASNAMIATTIMISTSVKPACFDLICLTFFIALVYYLFLLVRVAIGGRTFYGLRSHNSFPATPLSGMTGE